MTTLFVGKPDYTRSIKYRVEKPNTVAMQVRMTIELKATLKLKEYYELMVKKSPQQRNRVLDVGQSAWRQVDCREAGTGILSSKSHLICTLGKKVSDKR